MTKDTGMTTATRTIRVEGAARMLGISRRAAYRAAATGDLPAIKVGGRVLVLRDALDRLLAGETLAQREGGGKRCRA